MLLSFRVGGEAVESGQNEKGAEDTCSEVDKRGGCLRGAPYQPRGCPEVLVGETFLCAVNRDKTRKPGGTRPEVVSSLPQPIWRVGLDGYTVGFCGYLKQTNDRKSSQNLCSF